MSLESGLYALLSGANTSAGDRIYPERLPQTPTLPAITFDYIDGLPQYHRDGDDLDRIRVQLNLWTQTAGERTTLTEEVRAVTSGYSGAPNGETFLQILWDNIQNGEYDPALNLYSRLIDLIVWHRRN